MINPVRNGEFRGSFLYIGPDPRQLCVGPHKINKFIMLCRKKMIYFVHNGCYWITSAIDKNYSNIFVLKCVQDKKGEGFIPFKKKLIEIQ